jgi:hypothetical protein
VPCPAGLLPPVEGQMLYTTMLELRTSESECCLLRRLMVAPIFVSCNSCQCHSHVQTYEWHDVYNDSSHERNTASKVTTVQQSQSGNLERDRKSLQLSHRNEDSLGRRHNVVVGRQHTSQLQTCFRHALSLENWLILLPPR